MTELYRQHGFDRFVLTLPGVTLVDQWESHVAKVGGKVFALLGRHAGMPSIVVKCSEESFEILTALDGIGQAPYFAKRAWVSISETAPLEPGDHEEYLRRSYALVAAGLTQKLRKELGIPITK